MSYTRHSLAVDKLYIPAEMLLVYSTVPDDCAVNLCSLLNAKSSLYICFRYTICKRIFFRKYFQTSQISFVCSQLNGFKFKKWLHISIWSFDGILTGTNTSGKSGPGSNGNEGVLHISQNSWTGASSSDAVYCHIQEFRIGWEVTRQKRFSLYILQPQMIGLSFDMEQFIHFMLKKWCIRPFIWIELLVAVKRIYVFKKKCDT